MVLTPAHNYYIGYGATSALKSLLLWMSAVLYCTVRYLFKILARYIAKPKKKSPSPLPHARMKHLCFIISSDPIKCYSISSQFMPDLVVTVNKKYCLIPVHSLLCSSFSSLLTKSTRNHPDTLSDKQLIIIHVALCSNLILLPIPSLLYIILNPVLLLLNCSFSELFLLWYTVSHPCFISNLQNIQILNFSLLYKGRSHP
jgi:hypothetical protein